MLDSPIAAVSPNGRYCLIDNPKRGIRLTRVGAVSVATIRRIPGTIFNYFVTTPWSLDSKTYLSVTGHGFGSGISNTLFAYNVAIGERMSLYAACGVKDATFSPTGDEVAFITEDLKSLLRESIVVWKPGFGGNAGVSKTFNFDKGVEHFTWIDGHRLLAFTPGVNYPKYIPKTNPLILVDTQSESERQLRIRPSGMISEVWPYSDAAKKAIVMWHPIENVTSSTGGYYILSETDTSTGQMTDIAKLHWRSQSGFYPLSCGPKVTYLERYHLGASANSVDLWPIDRTHRSLGQPVTLRLYGLPSVDSKGKIFGWIGKNAGHAITEGKVGILSQ